MSMWCKIGWHTWDKPAELPNDPSECLRRDIKQTCIKCGMSRKLVGWRYGINSYPDYSPRYETAKHKENTDDR